MDKEKIPKIIHYCWFGNGSKSELAQKCIDGWRRILHEYEFKEWNEKNFDININIYVKQAYERKKYAFVSDYVRLYALYNYGGIYLDTDVEIIESFNQLLSNKGFIGFEDEELISTAVIGAEKENLLIKKWLDTYENREFEENGKVKDVTNVRCITDLLLNHGLNQNNQIQLVYDEYMTIYPQEYFSPLKIGQKEPKITSNTKTIHWFEGTWVSLGKRIKIKFVSLIKARIGFKNYNKLKKLFKS